MKKILTIVHDIHLNITDKTIHDTLTNHYGECHFEAIRFSEINIELGDNSQLMWQTLKAQQVKFFEEVIAPKIKEDSERQIVYFGLAPIPLCMHLGFLVGGITDVEIFQHHHDQKHWHWSGKPAEKPLIDNLPNEQFDGDGDVIIRFGAYTKINELDTEEIIEKPIRSVDIHPKNTDRDLLGSQDDAKAYSKVFFDVLKRLKETLPLSDEWHVFAAVPCGLAFLMGTEIQPNIHKPIVVYHYSNQQTPPYKEAFCIQEKGGENLIIPEGEKSALDDLREELALHFHEDVLSLLQTQKDLVEKNWFQALFPTVSDILFTSKIWNDLPKISDTHLIDTTFITEPKVENQNKFFVDGEWYLPNSFLFGLKKKFDPDDLKRAIRLFWFHEGIHFTKHGLHSDNSSGMGEYPYVLEDADYQSDVYAMLNEFKFSEEKAKENVPEFFADLIRIAIETMLVFDEFSRPNSMEVRRVKRYLIWFFQLARIQDLGCQTLVDVLKILALKPQMDIKLPIRQEEANRIHFQLKGYKKEDVRIAFFYQNRVATFGYKDGQLSIDQLVDGLRERRLEPIKLVMRQILGELKPFQH